MSSITEELAAALRSIVEGSRNSGRYLDASGTECEAEDTDARWEPYTAEENSDWLSSVVGIAEGALASYDTGRGQESAVTIPRPRIGIKMEGGVIQNVFADTDASIYVINYDTEDASPPDGYEDESHALCQLEQDDGGTAECVLSRYGAEISPLWFARMDGAISARVAELNGAEEDSEAPRP